MEDADEFELVRFPVEKVAVKPATMSGSLVFNPYADLPPSLWYKVVVPLEPIDIGDAEGVVGKRVLELQLDLGGIVLPQRDWTQICGATGPVEDQGESYVYVVYGCSPIDIQNARFQRLDDTTTFRVDAELDVLFEYESSGFLDNSLSVSAEADFCGLSFDEPQWNDPDDVVFPNEWRIPDEYTKDTVLEMFERFVDTSVYRYEKAGRRHWLRPC